MTEISKEYAAALFSIAKDEGKTKEYLQAMNLIKNEFDANKEYFQILASPAISTSERCALISKAFASSVPENVLSFLQLLCQRGHIKKLESCFKEFDELYRAENLVSSAKIISAVELSEIEKAALVKKLEAVKKHALNAVYEVDADIMGGIIIYLDDTVIDGSLRSKLKDIKEVIGNE